MLDSIDTVMFFEAHKLQSSSSNNFQHQLSTSMACKRWIHNGEVVHLFTRLCNVSQVNEQTVITLGNSVIRYKPTQMHLL